MMSLVSDRWLVLAALFLARTAIAYQFQTAASAGPLLVDALAFDFALLGVLIGLFMLPGVAIALPGGILGQRFGAKRIVLVGLGLMAAGGLLMSSDAHWLLFAGRLVSGIGAVLVNVLLTKMVTDWFAGREIVTAMAVIIASWPLGIALGLMTFPVLAAAFTWQAIMVAGAVVPLAGLVLVAMIYRDPQDTIVQLSPGFSIALSGREWLLVSLAGMIWGAFNVSYVVLVSFLPELFTAFGYNLLKASQIVSLLGWVPIVSVPLGGYLADQINRPNLLMIGGLAAVGLATLLIPFLDLPLVPFAVIVVAIGLPPALIMALPAQALRVENRSSGMGIFYTFFYGSMAALPAVAGLVRDISGSPAAPPLFAAMMMTIAVVCLVAFRIVCATPTIMMPQRLQPMEPAPRRCCR